MHIRHLGLPIPEQVFEDAAAIEGQYYILPGLADDCRLEVGAVAGASVGQWHSKIVACPHAAQVAGCIVAAAGACSRAGRQAGEAHRQAGLVAEADSDEELQAAPSVVRHGKKDITALHIGAPHRFHVEPQRDGEAGGGGAGVLGRRAGQDNSDSGAAAQVPAAPRRRVQLARQVQTVAAQEGVLELGGVVVEADGG